MDSGKHPVNSKKEFKKSPGVCEMTINPQEMAYSSRSISAVPAGEFAALLRKTGSRLVTDEGLREDLAAGAPRNPDGSVNLVHYAAWLAKEAATHGD
jgi:hypothetical protein